MKKTILVTGASRGIGREIALECSKLKINMMITCLENSEKLEEVASICRANGSDCKTFLGDLGNRDTVHQLFEKIEGHYEGVDVLINNAGVSYVGLMTDMTYEEWEYILHANLSSVFYCCQEAIPYMVRKKSGKIFNISSIWGNVGASCEVAYSATKGGINSLTKALGKELAPSNIQVNALALGVIDTEMNQCFSEEERNMLIEEIPSGRMGTAKEVGELIVSLLEGHTYLTGQILTVDGGML